MPISGTILYEKAKQFNEQLHAQEATAPSFTASSGWLWHFCNQHGICGLRLQCEKLSGDTEVPEPFKKELQDVMSVKASHLSKFTIAMKRGYTIKCFLQKPSLPKLKEMHQV